MAKRAPSICSRVYLTKDGEELKKMPADPSNIVSQAFNFTDGTTRVFSPGDFAKNIQLGALFHGLNQALGDSFATAAGDVTSAIADFDARYETLTGGNWTSRTGTGTKMDSILVDAVLATYADNKIDKTSAQVRAYFLCENVVGDDAEVKKERSDRRAKWMKRADTAAHYDRIRAERAAKVEKTDAKSDEAKSMLSDIE